MGKTLNVLLLCTSLALTAIGANRVYQMERPRSEYDGARLSQVIPLMSREDPMLQKYATECVRDGAIGAIGLLGLLYLSAGAVLRRRIA